MKNYSAVVAFGGRSLYSQLKGVINTRVGYANGLTKILRMNR